MVQLKAAETTETAPVFGGNRPADNRGDSLPARLRRELSFWLSDQAPHIRQIHPQQTIHRPGAQAELIQRRAALRTKFTVNFRHFPHLQKKEPLFSLLF